MSIQLMCINYGNLYDAAKVVSHCLRIFPRFESANILHPNPFPVDPLKWVFGFPKNVKVFEAKSPTQNECVLHEQPLYVTCDHVLNVQWDGFIINPESWTDEFLEYDLVAAPWPLTNLPNPEWRVGSTGIGLYSRRLVENWTKICAPHPAYNDWEMGALKRDRFEALGMKFAPLELAMRFAEEIPLEDQPRVEKPFGIHGLQYDTENRRKYFENIYG